MKKSSETLRVEGNGGEHVAFTKLASLHCENPTCHDSDIWGGRLVSSDINYLICVNCGSEFTLNPWPSLSANDDPLAKIISKRIKEHVEKNKADEKVIVEACDLKDAISQLEVE